MKLTPLRTKMRKQNTLRFHRQNLSKKKRIFNTTIALILKKKKNKFILKNK